MQQFFTDTIESRFIKDLIYTTPIPRYNTVNKGGMIYKNQIYAYKSKIIRCTKTGYLDIVPVPALTSTQIKEAVSKLEHDLKDVNGDGKLTLRDLSEIRYDIDNGIYAESADQNNDGIVDLNDYNLMVSYVLRYYESDLEVTDPLLQQRATYQTLSNYTFGKDYPKFTERFSSNSQYYDSITHAWLGKLLRCYRDFWDLDLMPFYNCFNEAYISGLKISSTEITDSPNSSYKTLMVPVKFNQVYTIAIDCASEVYIAPAIISNNNLSKVIVGDQEINLTSLVAGDDIISGGQVTGKTNIVRVNDLSYKQPILYKVENLSEDPMRGITYSYKGTRYTPTVQEFLSTYENQLYMLIQLPTTNDSSICILEGDYTELDSTRIINFEDLSKIPPQVINDTYLGNLSLLQLSDTEDYAFSDRLIEFLLWNVICHKDLIDENIARVQDKLNYTIYTPNSIKGVWSTGLRDVLYNLYMSQNNYEILDVTGFVDKDVEKYLTRQV